MRTPSLGRQLVRFILLINAGIVILFVSVIAPSFDRIGTLGDRLEDTERMLLLYREKTHDVKKTQESVAEISKEAETYAGAVISKGDELALITRLEALAKEHRITQQLNARLVSPARNEQPYYEFSFKNTGLFHDQLNYLRALEQLPQYLVIPSLEWQAGAQKNVGNAAAPPVTVTFHAIVYAAPLE
ncbi:MAG: hypothetical protein A3C90_01375 [Candidatus Magasanikbacteria bacterium RIFCSPHIGHO2_02_FULL_51_14]|uniref:Uncharacterized protein n=1 Tax=Candidatus Magasanikbacteria bacterium RIFCSPHIGHO2_02_FULL_51_14 TaxID=1798683 RepID=A0A1F6MHT9_9BACT|nr:MAG: hypothetical protein A3C90_01375 [Candidatus Magasanikbacteria bacterium RIFCSPHIGHO2_02_FULL_51_14]